MCGCAGFDGQSTVENKEEPPVPNSKPMFDMSSITLKKVAIGALIGVGAYFVYTKFMK